MREIMIFRLLSMGLTIYTDWIIRIPHLFVSVFSRSSLNRSDTRHLFQDLFPQVSFVKFSLLSTSTKFPISHDSQQIIFSSFIHSIFFHLSKLKQFHNFHQNISFFDRHTNSLLKMLHRELQSSEIRKTYSKHPSFDIPPHRSSISKQLINLTRFP